MSGACEKQQIPEHWHRHRPRGVGFYSLAVDFEDVDKTPLHNPDSENMIQLCPACGHKLTAYHSKYSGMASDFKECMCGNCLTVLFRRTSVIATETAADNLTTDELQAYVKNRADRAFWSGEMSRCSPAMLNGMEEPPTPILGTKDIINDATDGWEPRCPCCGQCEDSDVEFDFHHWDYQDDIGCQLCRRCHSHIHRGMRASEQDGLNGKWQRDAIGRLYERSVENGLSYNNAPEFWQRYNIPRYESIMLDLGRVISSE